VTYPAYPDSGVAVAQRSYDLFREQQAKRSEKRSQWIAKTNEYREWLEKYGEDR